MAENPCPRCAHPRTAGSNTCVACGHVQKPWVFENLGRVLAGGVFALLYLALAAGLVAGGWYLGGPVGLGVGLVVVGLFVLGLLTA